MMGRLRSRGKSARAGRGRRLGAILVALILVASGCSTSEPEPEPTTTTRPDQTTTTRPAPTAPDTAEPGVDYKPVLYLYPREASRVSVDLDYAGDVTITYPQAQPGDTWTVDANPDGTLTDERGRQYPYLFWEGVAPREYSQDEGFVVAGDQAVPFLEEKLAVLGLSDREAAEFISFWGPRLAANEYNLVTFATEQYSNTARYTFTDASGRQFTPDTFIRVFMVHSPAEASTKVSEQVLEPAPQREGFVAVEWGGTTQEAR